MTTVYVNMMHGLQSNPTAVLPTYWLATSCWVFKMFIYKQYQADKLIRNNMFNGCFDRKENVVL
jgi:hypothetical protein